MKPVYHINVRTFEGFKKALEALYSTSARITEVEDGNFLAVNKFNDKLLGTYTNRSDDPTGLRYEGGVVYGNL